MQAGALGSLLYLLPCFHTPASFSGIEPSRQFYTAPKLPTCLAPLCKDMCVLQPLKTSE